jgi:hypothetical protein
MTGTRTLGLGDPCWSAEEGWLLDTQSFAIAHAIRWAYRRLRTNLLSLRPERGWHAAPGARIPRAE